MTKGKGWYGDRTRHALASKGVRTSFNPNIVRHKGNVYLEADGVLYQPRKEFVKAINGQLKCLKAYGEWDDPDFYDTWGQNDIETKSENSNSTNYPVEVEPPEKQPTTAPVTLPPIPPPDPNYVPPHPSPENDERFYEYKEEQHKTEAEIKNAEAKDETEMAKMLEDEGKYYEKMAKMGQKEIDAERKAEEKKKKEELRKKQAEAGVGVGGAVDLLTKAGKSILSGFKKFVSISPNDISPPSSHDMKNRNTPFGKTARNRSSDTHKSDPSKRNDVTKADYKSVDSDSIIATVENKEKLIGFANNLEHDINLLEVSFQKHKNDFRTEEKKDMNLVRNEIKKARDELKEEINLEKISGQKESEIKYNVNNLKTNYEFQVDNLKNALKNQKLQHKADLKYIDDLKDDLNRLHNQVDDRIKIMTASGHRK